MLDFARNAPIDATYLRHVVARLSSIGSSPLGFRATGTPEDRAVADFAASEMRDIGLSDVALEPVPVDGWRFIGATVQVTGGAGYECAAMGGAPPTGKNGVLAPLVDVGTGERKQLDRLDLSGRIALLDWRSSSISPSDIGLELGLRGVLGIVLNCPEGGPFYQSPRALGSFSSHWHAGAPPFVTMCKEDAAELRAAQRAAPLELRLTLRADLKPGVPGYNVVGYLPGRRRGAPIVVGAHHDGWFSAAFDNASGVAGMLALARALAHSGLRPEHSLCFTSRTAEEYGLTDSAYNWCTGAWGQIDSTHRAWGAGSPFHLNLEASGHPGLRLLLEAPVELVGWARRLARAGAGEGWLTSGWRVSGAPVTGTELWPFLISGVPGVSAYTWERSFMRTDYHTQFDTIETIDFAHLERLCRFYAFLLLSADADPGGILDHRARARDLARAAAAVGEDGAALAAAAGAHAELRGGVRSPPSGAGSTASTRTAPPPIRTLRPRATSRAWRLRSPPMRKATDRATIRRARARGRQRARAGALAGGVRHPARAGPAAAPARGLGRAEPPACQPEPVARARVPARGERRAPAGAMAHAFARAAPRALARRARAAPRRHAASPGRFSPLRSAR